MEKVLPDLKTSPCLTADSAQEKSVFDRYVREYDAWFENNMLVYASELELLKSSVAKHSDALEIGVGTGRFAEPLKIPFGVDPSREMIKIAAARGIQPIIARGEELPFKSNSFDLALIVTTLCFSSEPQKIIAEAHRVLRKKGKIVACIIDRESPLGLVYDSMKIQNCFYANANFLSTLELKNMIGKLTFENIRVFQTIFHMPSTIKKTEGWEKGHGKGLFAAVCAEKSRE